MRLLLVNAHGAPDGGTETVLAELATGLLAMGVEVSFLQAFPPAGLVDGVQVTVLHDVHWRESEVRRLKNHIGDVVSWPAHRFEKVLEAEAPDVVHTHNLPGIGSGIWEAARRRGLPVVHTLHDYHLLCPRTTLMRLDGDACRPHPLLCGLRTRRLGRYTGAVKIVTAVSQYLHDVHEPFFAGIDQRVIRNPLRAPSGDPEPPGTSLRRIGYVGALHPNKGVDVLLHALPALEARGLVLRIAGRGVLEEAVARAAATSAAIEHVGFVTGEAKARFLAGCDLGIVPSVWREPGGPNLAMAEWLAARRPVLVSCRGGLAEVAGTYRGSVAIEPTVDDILRAVDLLLDPDTWAGAVQDARDLDADGASRHWADEYLAVYQELHESR